MKQSILIAAAAAVSAMFGVGAASAADLPMKAPPPPVPVWTWTGVYGGLNLGGTWANDGVSHSAIAGPCNAVFAGCTSVPNYSATLAAGSTFATRFGNNNNAGFTGGGQLGYNWQFGKGVAGLEADMNWMSPNRSVTVATLTPNVNFPGFPEAYTNTITRGLDYLATVRGRLGFLASQSLLLYGTGGFAWGAAASTTTENVALVGGTSVGVGGGQYLQTRVGWAAGAGAEWMFAPNWSAKVEYLYYDLGTANYATALNQINTPTGLTFASTTGTTSVRYSGSIARVGINWHYN
jgi:outer membrane immunogenic protein